MRDYQHLVGRPFEWGTHDCFGLVRDFYRDILDIELPNYARPDAFWEKGMNLFAEHYRTAGFYPLERTHPTDWQVGDVLLSAIMSPFGNHTSVLVENGRILHHLYGRISTVETFKGLVRNTLVGVYRHQDIDLSKIQTNRTQDIRDFLSPGAQKKLDALRNPGAETL